MKHDPAEVKANLKDIRDTTDHPARDAAREALALIRQMEGDLRRAGFTEYNDPTDKSTIE
jgi:hypothetical protein